MRVWLDDVRPAPTGWFPVRTAQEAIEILATRPVEEISLDHDLGIFHETGEETGYDVLLWIEERVICDGYLPPKIHIHTDNPGPRKRMLQAISQIQRHAQ